MMGHCERFDTSAIAFAFARDGVNRNGTYLHVPSKLRQTLPHASKHIAGDQREHKEHSKSAALTEIGIEPEDGAQEVR
jgi:hypothetical protein